MTRQHRANVDGKTVALLLGLILITAITFGVFINTIGVLQTQTESQPTEALSVADHEFAINDPNATAVDVSDGMGDDGDPVAYELRIELQHPPDSPELDLTALQLDIESSAGVGTFQHVSTNTEDGALDPDGDVDGTNVARDVYFVEPVSVDTVDARMTDDGDRYELVIPLGVFVDHDGMLTESPTSDAAVAAPERGYDGADVAVEVPAILDDGEGLDNSGVGPLEGSDTISLTITTEHGGTESIEFQVPEPLSDDAGGSV